MINRLRVQNFRCLEDFTLNLSGQSSTLLIGKNGSGKSTVLKALSIFQSIGRGPNRVREVIGPNDFSNHDRNGVMRFEMEFELGERNFQYVVGFEWLSEASEGCVVEELLIQDENSIFRRDRDRVELSDGAEFGLDRHVFALPVLNVQSSERAIRDVRSYFARLLLLTPVPQRMGGFSQEPSTALASDASNFASCLRALFQSRPNAYSVLEKSIRDVMPEFSSVAFIDRGRAGGSQLVVAFERSQANGTLSLEFDELSDGEKCFILAAYVNALNAARAECDSPVVCVWDEPDTHLSLSEVGHFTMAMRKMTNRGGQFIATSHHPEVIQKFSDENTLVLSRNSLVESTSVQPLSAHPYEGDLIHALVRDDIPG